MSPRSVHKTGIPGLTFDKANAVYIWRNRANGKRVRLGTDFEAAKKEALTLNETADLLVALKNTRKMLPMTVGNVVDLFLDSEVSHQPWQKKTRENNIAALKRYKREFGDRTFANIDRIFLGEWLDGIQGKADTRNGHRHLLIKLWAFGLARGLTNTNEAAATLKRSMSPLIETNKKDRQRLQLDEFWKVHEKAPLFMQIAMELSLLTLQARGEVIRMSKADIRDGRLYIVRQKTAYQTDLAFIAIEITPDLQSVIDRAMTDGLVCPYFVRTTPKRRRLVDQRKKLHPLCVTPDHLSKTFKKIRDETKSFDDLMPLERPTFHEIRSLGGRLMKKAGYTKDQIKGFYGHTDQKMSDRYLDDPGSITDEDFQLVRGGLRLLDLK